MTHYLPRDTELTCTRCDQKAVVLTDHDERLCQTHWDEDFEPSWKAETFLEEQDTLKGNDE